MKIYGSMCVKNEGDILSDSLCKALKWADVIFAIDNGSTDNTADVLKSFGDRVVFLGSFVGEFREGLKSIPFNWVNSSRTLDKPDWWAVVDADEYYLDDPKSFMTSVPKRFSRVCTNTIEFIGLRDEKQPLLPDSYDYYIPLDWSESRFYRNIKSLYWDDYRLNGPRGVGATYPERIRMLHFPFRTRAQVEKRMEIRRKNKLDSGISWGNSDYADFNGLMRCYSVRERIINNGDLLFRTSAVNFLSSKQQKLAWFAKQMMYVFGLYR